MIHDVLPQGILSAFPDVTNNVPCQLALRNIAARLCIMHQLFQSCSTQLPPVSSKDKKKKKKEVSKNTCMKGRRLLSTLYVVHICKLLNFCIKASYVFNRNAEMVICPQVMTSCLRCFCQLGMQVDLLKLKIGSFIRSGIVNIKKQHCGFICLYILCHC